LHGGITLKELMNMPFRQYLALKVSCELEQLRERMTNIHDNNHAFNNSKDIIERLKRDYNTILDSLSKNKSSKSISWKIDGGDGLKKLKSMQR
jgi:hypothetical protein